MNDTNLNLNLNDNDNASATAAKIQRAAERAERAAEREAERKAKVEATRAAKQAERDAKAAAKADADAKAQADKAAKAAAKADADAKAQADKAAKNKGVIGIEEILTLTIERYTEALEAVQSDLNNFELADKPDFDAFLAGKKGIALGTFRDSLKALAKRLTKADALIRLASEGKDGEPDGIAHDWTKGSDPDTLECRIAFGAVEKLAKNWRAYVESKRPAMVIEAAIAYRVANFKGTIAERQRDAAVSAVIDACYACRIAAGKGKEGAAVAKVVKASGKLELARENYLQVLGSSSDKADAKADAKPAK